MKKKIFEEYSWDHKGRNILQLKKRIFIKQQRIKNNYLKNDKKNKNQKLRDCIFTLIKKMRQMKLTPEEVNLVYTYNKVVEGKVFLKGAYEREGSYSFF